MNANEMENILKKHLDPVIFILNSPDYTFQKVLEAMQEAYSLGQREAGEKGFEAGETFGYNESAGGKSDGWPDKQEFLDTNYPL